MIFKVGDKVKFLDEVGEGVINRIISANQVEVETDSGFSIPYLAKNLIKVGDNDEIMSQSESDEISEEFKSEAVSAYSKKEEKNKVFLSLIPYDQNLLISGDLELKIVNLLKYPIHFQIVNKLENSTFKHRASAIIQSEESYFVKNISRDELNEFLEGFFQMLIVNEVENDKIFTPVNVSFKLRGSKFYKEASYKDSGFINRKSINYKLFDISEADAIKSGIVNLKEDTKAKEVTAEEHRVKNQILKHKTANKTAEVDMHIWEITEDHEVLKKEEMLAIQMGYFVDCLESAIEHEFEKVIFIHGVGVGRLKKEIRDYLDDKENISYKDASLQKYGVGATEIEIR